MESWPVNPVDALVLLILVISAVLAFFRGLVHELLSVLALAGAILVAYFGLPLLGPVFTDFVPSAPMAADIGAVVVLFLVSLLVFSILATQIYKHIQMATRNSLDRTLGFAFGLFRGGMIVIGLYAVLAWLLPVQDHPDWMRQAKSMPMIERGTATVMAMLPAAWRAQGQRLEGDAQATRKDAEDLLKTGRTLNEVQKEFERMNTPRPEAPDAPANKVPGYGQGQREDMNRLIESTQ
ncbi:CvpA family protein [Rhodospirillum sp. A1_3_36]|uniref:CvpA family protein n=1 Tax=Rhodospirillum sp. A1_3_36 TaxID=3391666 RepID=UPI0039A4987B